MSPRREMELRDWFNVAFNVVIGVLLGIAVSNLVKLIAMGFWPMALILVLGFGAVFLFELLSDKLMFKFFKMGIRPAPDHYAYSRPVTRKPLLRVLSFPVALLVGVVVDRLGLATALLKLFS